MVNMALGDAGFLCLRARDGDEALQAGQGARPRPARPRRDDAAGRRARGRPPAQGRRHVVAHADPDAHGARPASTTRSRASRPAPTPTCPSRSTCASSARGCKALIRAARRERDRNPTTNLPGSRAIDEEIEGALKSGKPDRGRCTSTSCSFDALRRHDRHRARPRTRCAPRPPGARRGRARVTEGGAFVGHLGGSDFIAVIAPGPGRAVPVRRPRSPFDSKRRAVPGRLEHAARWCRGRARPRA